MLHKRLTLVIVPILLLLAERPGLCERPHVARLLPENTAILVHVTDVQETARRLGKTTFADVLHDESLQPLLRKVQNILEEPRRKLEERVGIDLKPLLQVPQGDVVFAVFSLDQPSPAVVLMMDVGQEETQVSRLSEQLELQLLGKGANFESRSIRDTPVSVFQWEEPPREVALCRREQSLILASDAMAVEEILARWDGELADECLEKQDHYRDAIRFARAPQPGHPGVFCYLEPIECYRAFTVDNFAAKAASAFFPTLGVDGVRGIGASAVLREHPFDWVLHVHLVLDEQRRGVVRAIALDETNINPPIWVPANVTVFQTFRWKFQQSANALRGALEGVQGEGAWEKFVLNPASSRLGVDLEKDVLAAFTGDVVRLTWYEEGPVETGNAEEDLAAFQDRARTIWAVKVREPEQFAQTLQKVIDQSGEEFQREELGEVVVFSSTRSLPSPDEPQNGEPADNQQRRRRRRQRRLQSNLATVFAVFQDYLLFSNHVSAVERILECNESGPSLVDLPLFHDAVDAARHNFGGGPPMVLNFTRNDLLWQFRWSMLRSQALRDLLKERSEDNEVALQLLEALDDHPLPSWERFRNYMAPTISVVADGEHGIHYTQYRLRPAEPGERPE